MNFPAYPEYKATDKIWLPKRPTHWGPMRSKWLFSNRREQALNHDEQLAATQKYGVIPQRELAIWEDKKPMLALSGTENFRHVEKDDFVIAFEASKVELK